MIAFQFSPDEILSRSTAHQAQTFREIRGEVYRRPDKKKERGGEVLEMDPVYIDFGPRPNIPEELLAQDGKDGNHDPRQAEGVEHIRDRVRKRGQQPSQILSRLQEAEHARNSEDAQNFERTECGKSA